MRARGPAPLHTRVAGGVSGLGHAQLLVEPVLQLVEQQLEVEHEQQLVVLQRQLVAVLVEPFSSCSVSVMSRTSKLSDSSTPNSPRSAVRDISHPLSLVLAQGAAHHAQLLVELQLQLVLVQLPQLLLEQEQQLDVEQLHHAAMSSPISLMSRISNVSLSRDAISRPKVMLAI